MDASDGGTLTSQGHGASAGHGRPVVVRISGWLALASGVMLIFVSALVTVSVLMRWLADGGLPGDFETVEMATAVFAFAVLPLCQQTRGNIIVDSFSKDWSRRTTILVDALWDLVYAGAALLIAWGAWQGARDAIANGSTTMVLQLPVGWAMMLTVALALWLAIGAAYVAVRRILGARP